MTALRIETSASAALTDLIWRLINAGAIDADEMADTIALLQAIRAKLHNELGEARGKRWEAAIVTFGKHAPRPDACDQLLAVARAMRGDDTTPSDSPSGGDAA